MSDKHILYFTAVRAVLYRWHQGRLTSENSFPNSEEGAEAFSQYISARKLGLFYLLADVVEEDFHQDTIPFVRGADRRALLDRKLAQRYRDTSLSLALSMGYEKTQRRDEKILFSSFTNTQQFQPWLAAARERDLTIAGVYSIALLAGPLAIKLGAKKGPALIVTLEEAGLRQSFVEGGKLRFSRLGPLDAASVTNPDRVAEAFDRETTRVYQYLSAMRVLQKDAPPLETALVAPSGQRERILAAAPRVPQLRVTVVDLDDGARAVGLRGLPPGAGAEALFLHLLAKAPPREQYARENLRGAFRVWQWRNAMVWGSAAAMGGCMLYAGVNLLKVHDLKQEIEADRSQAQLAGQTYSGVTAKFPPVPTSSDNLRTTMERYGTVVKQTRTPKPLLVDISRALGASPKIELESLRWETTMGLKLPPKEGEARPAATPAPVVPGTGKPTEQYETVEVTARVVSTRIDDYRGTMAVVNEFLDSLRKQPGLEVVRTDLPFELGTQKSLTGDVGAVQKSEEPLIKVMVARKVGTWKWRNGPPSGCLGPAPSPSSCSPPE